MQAMSFVLNNYQQISLFDSLGFLSENIVLFSCQRTKVIVCVPKVIRKTDF